MNELLEVLKVLFVLGICISFMILALFFCHYLLNISRGMVSFLDRRKSNIVVEKDRRKRGIR